MHTRSYIPAIQVPYADDFSDLEELDVAAWAAVPAPEPVLDDDEAYELAVQMSLGDHEAINEHS